MEGDGSIQLNIQELASIRGMNLPIKIFINGNGGYASIINMQTNHFGGRYVGANENSGLYFPDIIAVARAYGLNTYVIKNHAETESVIKSVLRDDGPALCYVHMRTDIPVQPKVVSRVTADGSIQSGSLSDLWPFVD